MILLALFAALAGENKAVIAAIYTSMICAVAGTLLLLISIFAKGWGLADREKAILILFGCISCLSFCLALVTLPWS